MKIFLYFCFLSPFLFLFFLYFFYIYPSLGKKCKNCNRSFLFEYYKEEELLDIDVGFFYIEKHIKKCRFCGAGEIIKKRVDVIRIQRQKKIENQEAL